MPAVRLEIETQNLEILLNKFLVLVEIEEKWNKKHINYESDFNMLIGPINKIDYICRKL